MVVPVDRRENRRTSGAEGTDGPPSGVATVGNGGSWGRPSDLRPRTEGYFKLRYFGRRQREEQRVVIRGAYGHWHLTHFAHKLLEKFAGFYVYLFGHVRRWRDMGT